MRALHLTQLCAYLHSNCTNNTVSYACAHRAFPCRRALSWPSYNSFKPYYVDQNAPGGYGHVWAGQLPQHGNCCPGCVSNSRGPGAVAWLRPNSAFECTFFCHLLLCLFPLPKSPRPRLPCSSFCSEFQFWGAGCDGCHDCDTAHRCFEGASATRGGSWLLFCGQICSRCPGVSPSHVLCWRDASVSEANNPDRSNLDAVRGNYADSVQSAFRAMTSVNITQAAGVLCSVLGAVGRSPSPGKMQGVCLQGDKHGLGWNVRYECRFVFRMYAAGNGCCHSSLRCAVQGYET